MSNDLRILQFRIPDHIQPAVPSDDTRRIGTIAKAGIHEWSCQLMVLEDTTTIRATLGPMSHSISTQAELDPCCSLQVVSAPESGPSTAQVLMNKNIRGEDLFKRGIEFYLDRQDIWTDHHYEFSIILSSLPIKLLGPLDGPHWTHTLALSECDPVARNIDPLVEMMTQFEHDAPTSDVDCHIATSTGQVIDHLRAHQAILSIYPAFSEKMTRSQRNPHQRTTSSILVTTMEARAAFERMLSFIYSGRLPQEPFVPRSDQWRIVFELAKEYDLDKSASSRPWINWHLTELQQVITDENVLEIYFRWAYRFGRVAGICVRHVAERSQVQFQGTTFGSYVMKQLQDRYHGHAGCSEFQEAIVMFVMKMYIQQKQQQRASH
ncbi:hypothetical protein BGZ51_007240 [Haplosporangium sp. Z 767]|nr:hypothetical protein BGZ51_007240 [Haplosporangium sp. Z 767]